MRNKTLLSWLALCLLAIGSLHAQVKPKEGARVPENGKEYLIYDAWNSGQNRTGFRYVNAGEKNILTSYGKGDPVNYDLPLGAVWIIEINESGVYAFKNKVTGEYFAGTTTGTTKSTWTVKTVEEDESANNKWPSDQASVRPDYFGKNCFVVYNENTCWNGNTGGMATWTNAHPYQFYEFDAEQTMKITYVCKGPDGADLKTVAVDVKQDAQYILKFPTFDFLTLDTKLFEGEPLKSDTIKKVTEDMEIICMYKNYLPFEVSNIPLNAAEFPADAKFYKMMIHNDRFLVEYSPSDLSKLPAARKNADLVGIVPDSALWCFAGDRTSGFRIYNRATGPEQVLYSVDPKITDPNDAGTAYPHLARIDTIPQDAMVWKISVGAFANGYYFGLPVEDREPRLNKRGGVISYWQGNADAGSTFTFEYFNAQSPYLPMLKTLVATVGTTIKSDSLHAGNPGYASRADFNILYAAYKQAVDLLPTISPEQAESNFNALTAAHELYKTQRNKTFETFVGYTLTNTKDRGALYYSPEGSDIFAWSSGRVNAAPVDSLNGCWTLVPAVEADTLYYLYNIGRKQFLRYGADKETTFGDKKSWRFTSMPTPVTVTYEQDGFAFKPVVEAGAPVIGLSISNNYNHPVLTYYAAGDGGVPFRMNKKGVISEQEKATINEVLAKGKIEAGLTDAWTGLGALTAGANAKNVILARAVVAGTLLSEDLAVVEGMTVNLTHPSAVKNIKVYATTISLLNDTTPGFKELAAEVTSPAASMNITFTETQSVGSDPIYYWIVADLTGTPKSGEKIGASVANVKYSTTTNGKAELATGNATFASSVNIFDAQATLFTRTTLGSLNFGSPAIAKAPNGDLLAVTDVRYKSTGDLGNHKMSIATSISKDNGATWSDPTIILEGDSLTEEHFGFSSPSIAVDAQNGVIKMLVSGGKKAIGDGNKTLYTLESTDNGATWSEAMPVEVEYGNGKAPIYIAAITGNGVVLKNQSNDVDLFTNGTVIYPVRVKIGDYTYTYALADIDGTFMTSKTPVFESVQNATVQETADGKLIFTASTSRKDGARLKNVWEPTSVDPNNGYMILGEATVSSGITGTSNAAGLTIDGNGVNILTNVGLGSTKLMLNVSKDNGETWGVFGAKELQSRYAYASSVVANSDNSVSVFYQTLVPGTDTSYELTCIKVPYSYFDGILDNISGVENDQVQGAKNEQYYDLQGRKVGTPKAKGIYVAKGKKIVVK